MSHKKLNVYLSLPFLTISVAIFCHEFLKLLVNDAFLVLLLNSVASGMAHVVEKINLY